MDRNEKQNSFKKTRNIRGQEKKKRENLGRAAGFAIVFAILALMCVLLAVYLYWGR